MDAREGMADPLLQGTKKATKAIFEELGLERYGPTPSDALKGPLRRF